MSLDAPNARRRSGYSIARQITYLLDALNRQLHSLERGMAKLGVAPASESGSTSSIGDLVRFTSNPAITMAICR